MFTKLHCNTFFFFKNSNFIATPITKEITNSKEHGITAEADSSVALQEMLGIVWNPKAHCHICKTLPLVSLPSQLNAVHDTIYQFLECSF